MAYRMQNGGEVWVEDGALHMAQPRKTDDEGRPAPLSEEWAYLLVDLNDVEASFTRSTRLGDHGAVVVKHKNGGELVIRLTEDDALKLMAQLRPVKHVSDSDSSGAVEQ